MRLAALFLVVSIQWILGFKVISVCRLARSQQRVCRVAPFDGQDTQTSPLVRRRGAQMHVKEQGLPSGKWKAAGVSSRLRIVGGDLKGRFLQTPSVYLRPMMSKVRGALFNSLQSFFGGSADYLHNMKVLDLYAGSGSVGLEALSRGANHATFVDLSSECTRVCARNAAYCNFTEYSGHYRTVTAHTEKFLASPERFGPMMQYDIIVLSPPYKEVSYPTLLNAICNSRLLKANSLVAIEYPRDLGSLPAVVNDDVMFGLRNRKYGRTVLATYIFRPTIQFVSKSDEFEN